MAGVGARKQLPFQGAERVSSAADLDSFVARALAGERFVYCEARTLIPGEAAGKARALHSDGLVTLAQERRAGGGFNYLIVRTSRKLKQQPAARTGSMDPAMEAVLRALKRAANFERPCPSDSDLAEIAGLQTRDQAQWRIRKLIEAGLIQSVVAYEGGVPFRVVTIAATGKRTALPGKWAALEQAARKEAK